MARLSQQPFGLRYKAISAPLPTKIIRKYPPETQTTFGFISFNLRLNDIIIPIWDIPEISRAAFAF